ncbi:hypothetical protein [Loktanella sp. Alg231-35]|uniref:hypothetical protein n=1 Tax=Loktanella sp. Alg231-35 TaxID=1922220 RepID=UPI000D54BE52|nr:hypothetical protein [Loktanella sp. Alg231-35]
MNKALVAAALVVISGQAQALSCLRPDPITTFQKLAAASESYFVLMGELTFDENLLPEAMSNTRTDEPAPIPAYFAGKGLTHDGFANDYYSNVTLQIRCGGPWCGSASSGMEAIFFVPASDPPVLIEAGPCGGMIFENITPATVEMLTSCMAGDTCSSLPQTR